MLMGLPPWRLPLLLSQYLMIILMLRRLKMDPSRTYKQAHMKKIHLADVGNQADRRGEDRGPIPAHDHIPAPQTVAEIEGVEAGAGAEIAVAVALILETVPRTTADVGDHALGLDLEIGDVGRLTATIAAAAPGIADLTAAVAVAVADSFMMMNTGIDHVGDVVALLSAIVWPRLKILLLSSVPPML